MIDVETIFDSDREEYEFMQQKKEQTMKEQIEKMIKEIRYDADYSVFDMQRNFLELKKKYSEGTE